MIHFPLRIVLILALTIRLLVPLASWMANGHLDRCYAPDTATYTRPAQALIETGKYSVNGIPEVIRPPGYSIFLIPGLLFGNVVAITLALQIALGTATVYLVYRIAETFTGTPKAGLYAGLLAAIEPISVIFSCLLLAETIFTSLVCAGLYGLLRALKSQSVRAFCLAALPFALATWVRPIGYYLPLLLVLLLAIWRIPWHRIAVFALVAMSLPGFWQMRNTAVAGYAGFSAISAVNLYFYQAAAVQARTSGHSFYDIQCALGYGDETIYLAYHPEQRTWSQGERYRYMASEGLRILAGHPGTYAAIHLEGLVRVLFDPGAIDFLKLLDAYPERGGLLNRVTNQGLFAALAHLKSEFPGTFWSHAFFGLILLVYYALACLGLFRFRGGLPTVILLTVAFYFILLSGGPHSLGRFRHPVMPIVAVFAGIGVIHVLSSRHR